MDTNGMAVVKNTLKQLLRQLDAEELDDVLASCGLARVTQQEDL